MTQILPQGVDLPTYSRFFDELAAIVGKDHISRDGSAGALEGPHQQRSYGDPYPLGDAESRAPSGAVRPGSVPEIQAILKTASSFKIPLWTVSRGKNLGYGGTAPVVHGSVVLDLHRMNKIVELNEEYAYAIVEPGVSFFDLYNEIQERGLDLWPSCPAIGWGSVVGNTLDRGFGYTPNGEHTQAQCGMEVVLPNGDLLRTGMGAMDGSALWALFKGGFGPSVDGLFYQSNLGVVTKMGIHLTPAPESYMSCSVSVPREEDLVDLISTLSGLQRRGLISNSPSIGNHLRQAIVCQDPNVQAKLAPYCGANKRIPEEVLKDICAEKGWGFWKAEFALYGPAEVLPSMHNSLRRLFSKISGVNIDTKLTGGVPGKYLKATDVGEEEIPHHGVPTLAPLQALNYRGPTCGHTCFSPLIPPSGRELYKWYLSAKQRTIDANFDFFADFHVFPRYVIAIELVVYSFDERDRIDQLYRTLLQDAERQGFTEYRTHVHYMDMIKSHFSFNNEALGKFTGLLKEVLDPAGILSPGKSGNWGLTNSLRNSSTKSRM